MLEKFALVDSTKGAVCLVCEPSEVGELTQQLGCNRRLDGYPLRERQNCRQVICGDQELCSAYEYRRARRDRMGSIDVILGIVVHELEDRGVIVKPELATVP